VDILKWFRHLHIGACQFQFQYPVFFSSIVVIWTEVYTSHYI